MFHFPHLPPLTLYVHVPWCVRKCPYCDFNSHPLREELPESTYVQALLADLDDELVDLGPRPVESVFIGGGTPSLLSPRAIALLLEGVATRMHLPPDAEITLEANPGTTDQGRFRGYRQAGVNRLSIGVQSFQDEALRRLGRIHDGAEAMGAVKAAQAAGFDNLNLDLMFGLPQQGLAEALADLGQACALEPTHVSWYQLTLEPNTAFHHQPPDGLPDHDRLWEMHRRGTAVLADRGYRPYEVSAFARDAFQSRHNLNYWRFGDYLGIGAGAHGKSTHLAEPRIVRRWKRPHPRAYLRARGHDRLAEQRTLDPRDVVVEFMLNALRLVDGVPATLFAERTGLTLEQLGAGADRARERGLLSGDRHRLRATALGRRFLNDLLEYFIDDERRHTSADGLHAGLL